MTVALQDLTFHPLWGENEICARVTEAGQPIGYAPREEFAFLRLNQSLAFFHGISLAAWLKRGSNPSSDQSLPPPFAARSREDGRTWNEFLTNHRENQPH